MWWSRAPRGADGPARSVLPGCTPRSLNSEKDSQKHSRFIPTENRLCFFEYVPWASALQAVQRGLHHFARGIVEGRKRPFNAFFQLPRAASLLPSSISYWARK